MKIQYIQAYMAESGVPVEEAIRWANAGFLPEGALDEIRAGHPRRLSPFEYLDMND